MSLHRWSGVWLLLALVAGLDANAQNVCATGAALLVNPIAATVPSATGTGGIGGTGAVAAAPAADIDPGGIGGTGIVGVITGFASICVNGIEVHFSADTPVSNGGAPASAAQLAVGQLVAVHASGTGGALSAREIAMIDTALGPLSAVNAATGEFSLLGQKARALDPSMLAQLRTGDWVRVSGQRLAQGEIAASRIEHVHAQAQVQLTGTIDRLTGDSVVVAGAEVRLSPGVLAAGLAVGREITVSGVWDGRMLDAQRVLVEPTLQGLGTAGHVVLQGYVHAVAPHQIDLGLGVLNLTAQTELPGGTVSGIGVNQRVQVTGRIGADRQITVERVEISAARGDGGRGSARSDSRGGKGSGERAREVEGSQQKDSPRSGGTESGGGKSGGSEGGGKEGGSEGGRGK